MMHAVGLISQLNLLSCVHLPFCSEKQARIMVIDASATKRPWTSSGSGQKDITKVQQLHPTPAPPLLPNLPGQGF